MSDVNRTLTSLLLSHTICRHFWRIVVIEVSYILEWIFVFLEAQLFAHLTNYLIHIGLLNLFLRLGFSRPLAPIPVFLIAIPVNFLLVRFVFKQK